MRSVKGVQCEVDVAFAYTISCSTNKCNGRRSDVHRSPPTVCSQRIPVVIREVKSRKPSLYKDTNKMNKTNK